MRLDHVSMGAGHYNKRIHAAGFPATYVFIKNAGSVIHGVWQINGNDAVAFIRVYVLSIGDNMYEMPARSGAL